MKYIIFTSGNFYDCSEMFHKSKVCFRYKQVFIEKKFFIMRKFTVTEEEKKQILESHMSHGYKQGVLFEQSETYKLNMAIQCFLNKKGIKDDTGQPLKMDGSIGTYPNSKSAQAIVKYQTMIKVYPTDGVWGPDTIGKMPESDKKMYRECVSEHGDIIDKGLHLFGLDEQVTKLRTGESLNDKDLKIMACRTWNRWKGISTEEDVMKAKNWTKTVMKTEYPYDMDVVCKSTGDTTGIKSDADRMVLKGVIELAWI